MSEELNKAQAEAVDIVGGPALVVAGAGTGKTRVITERILKLIEKGVEPSAIIALTFTEKAAGEMLDRVAASSLKLALDVHIATFNGFGGEILSRYGSEWGLGSLSLLGETGQLVFLREHLDELELDYFAPVSNPDGQLANLRDYVSRLKQQLVKTEVYLDYAKKLSARDAAEKLEKTKHIELARFYDKYSKLCRQHQVIDYDDQVYLTVELLNARPNILLQLQEQYQYVLVDEFQDTNPMQSVLVDLLTGQHQNLMVVGDDDQSIYGWRGATLANILDFKKRYPKAREITLIENYRSTQPILDAAYRLIQNNNPERLEVINKLDKRLHAQTDGPAPKLQHFFTFESELTWVAEEIAQRVKGGEDPAQIAVLARGRASVDRVHEVLELHDIPHAVAGQKNNLYRQPAVLRLIETLKAIADPTDSLALFHALSGPVFNVVHSELAELNSKARSEHRGLAEIITSSDSQVCKQALQRLSEWRTMSQNESVGSLAYSIITDSGWKNRLYAEAQKDSEAYVQMQALSEYFKTLRDFERASGLPSVQSYILSLPTLEAGGSDFEDVSLQISDSAVNVMTVHSAKGLEWDTVFIVDLVERSFPLAGSSRGSLTIPLELQNVTNADDHMAEERRLMYVAVTRARRELNLSYSSRHGSGAHRTASRFITEMFGDINTAETTDQSDQTNLELFAPKQPGQTVASLPAYILKGGTLSLSASQIECWLNCPQDFYYKHVLAMPEQQSPLAAYGTAIHDVIRAIFDGRRAGQMPTLAELTKRVEQALSQTGYTSAGHRQRHHAQALKSLQMIYERFTKEELPSRDEADFAVTLSDLPIKITGRMDAIYERADGVEIRDFKTSTSVTTEQKAKQRATNSDQLTVYALVWQLIHGELPRLLALDFIETNQLGTVRKTQRGIDTLKSKLIIMNEQLRVGQYPPGRDHSYCSHPPLN
ncbi:MAG TPA: ATP-dependent DNA helicase [Candidatus Saccharimonadales bacterium]|nr:ATP-dependent DNA helicase [Candidatus Saccharimonadales bacterium]